MASQQNQRHQSGHSEQTIESERKSPTRSALNDIEYPTGQNRRDRADCNTAFNS